MFFLTLVARFFYDHFYERVKGVIFTKTRIRKLSEMVQDKSKNRKILLSNAQDSFSNILESF